jgi:hypothetical protein
MQIAASRWGEVLLALLAFISANVFPSNVLAAGPPSYTISSVPFYATAANSAGEVVGDQCGDGTTASPGLCLAPDKAVVQIGGVVYPLDQHADLTQCGGSGSAEPTALSLSEQGVILLEGGNGSGITNIFCVLRPKVPAPLMGPPSYAVSLVPFFATAANSSGEVVGEQCSDGTTAGPGICLRPYKTVVQIGGVVYALDQHADLTQCGGSASAEPTALSVSEQGAILLKGGDGSGITNIFCLLRPRVPAPSTGPPSYTISSVPFFATAANSSGEVVGEQCSDGTTAGPGICLRPYKTVVQIGGVVYPLDQHADLTRCGSSGSEEPVALSISEQGVILLEGFNGSGRITNNFCLLSPPVIVVGTSPNALSASPTPIVTTPTYIGVNGKLSPLHSTLVDGFDEIYVGCQKAAANQFTSGCTITVTVNEALQYSGGHQHDDGMRPVGEIVIADGDELLCTESGMACASQIKNFSAGGTDPTEKIGSANSTVTFTTMSTSSPIKLAYMSPQVGGDVNLTITATDTSGYVYPGIQQKIHVTTANSTGCSDAAGLVALCPLLGPASYFVLTDMRTGSDHPGSHYGTPLFLGNLSKIAYDWFNTLQLLLLNPVPLGINDMSVVDGGVLDFNDVGQSGKTATPWTNPHAAHRWGDMADIGSGNGLGINHWLPLTQRNALRALLWQQGYTPIIEAPCYPSTDLSTGTCTHWHIQPSVKQ